MFSESKTGNELARAQMQFACYLPVYLTLKFKEVDLTLESIE